MLQNLGNSDSPKGELKMKIKKQQTSAIAREQRLLKDSFYWQVQSYPYFMY